MSAIKTSLIGTKVKVDLDDTVQNEGFDGTSTVNISSKNKIKIGNFLWENVPLLSIGYKSKIDFPFDAVLSWLVFDDKIVEIDYETQKIILHNSLPELSSEYSKLEYKLMPDGIHYIKCKLVAKGKESETWFIFDTGANGELIISQKFAEENDLKTGITKIGDKKIKGSTGIEIEATKVVLSKLKFGDIEMYQIPMFIPSKDAEGIYKNEIIGNNILKRFNTFIDFRNELIYLKPNKLFYSKM